MTAVNSITSWEQAKTFIQTLHKDDVRCLQCNKLLAKINNKGIFAGQIKCPRCRTINEV
jgi:Zn finger protein HypA/HybF involved in hydrogenase expression